MLMTDKTTSEEKIEGIQYDVVHPGAFEEDDLSAADDFVDSTHAWTDEEPGFLEDDGVFLEPPTFITRAQAGKARDD